MENVANRGHPVLIIATAVDTLSAIPTYGDCGRRCGEPFRGPGQDFSLYAIRPFWLANCLSVLLMIQSLPA